MYAIIRAGGRQLKVTPGGFADLEGTAGEPGADDGVGSDTRRIVVRRAGDDAGTELAEQPPGPARLLRRQLIVRRTKPRTPMPPSSRVASVSALRNAHVGMCGTSGVRVARSPSLM